MVYRIAKKWFDVFEELVGSMKTIHTHTYIPSSRSEEKRIPVMAGKPLIGLAVKVKLKVNETGTSQTITGSSKYLGNVLFDDFIIQTPDGQDVFNIDTDDLCRLIKAFSGKSPSETIDNITASANDTHEETFIIPIFSRSELTYYYETNDLDDEYGGSGTYGLDASTKMIQISAIYLDQDVDLPEFRIISKTDVLASGPNQVKLNIGDLIDYIILSGNSDDGSENAILTNIDKVVVTGSDGKPLINLTDESAQDITDNTQYNNMLKLPFETSLVNANMSLDIDTSSALDLSYIIISLIQRATADVTSPGPTAAQELPVTESFRPQGLKPQLSVGQTLTSGFGGLFRRRKR